MVHVGKEAFELIKTNQLRKGDVLTTAQIAGIMGAKQTSNLIPLCHNLFISKADVQLALIPETASVKITSEARTIGQTGIEMEALTAATVAALTVYDMCKAVNKDIRITDVQLEMKDGGKSGRFER
jgi:cyclic pyranopterin monophosphate synthase